MSAQTENGYTAIANEILEVLMKTKINGTQFRIVSTVIRYTYGFKRKDTKLSLSFISQATSLNKAQIKRELDTLIDMNIITVVKEASFNSTRIVSFNKNHESWKTCTPISDQYAKQSTVCEADYTQYAKQSTQPVLELEYQEIKHINKTKKEILSENNSTKKNKQEPSDDFNELWKLYPNKLGKGDLLKKIDKVNKLIETIGFEQFKNCIDRYRKDKPNWKEWQHGSRFFNKGYIDYLDENYAVKAKPAQTIPFKPNYIIEEF